MTIKTSKRVLEDGMKKKIQQRFVGIKDRLSQDNSRRGSERKEVNRKLRFFL